jgi:hypothetical protein
MCAVKDFIKKFPPRQKLPQETESDYTDTLGEAPDIYNRKSSAVLYFIFLLECYLKKMATTF